MANRERGEVAVKTIDGQEYTCATSHNALCELMTAFEKKPEQIMEAALDGDPFAMRAAVWCFLQKFHKDEITTYEAAGEWLDRIGGAFGGMKLIGEIGKANLEVHGIKVPDEDKGNPPHAQTGTGAISSSPRSVPA